MKFAIDGSTLTGNKTGIDYMTEGIIDGFKEFSRHELIVYVTQNYTRKNNAGLSPNIKFVIVNKPTGLASGLRWYRRITKDMRVKKVDVFISPLAFTASLMFKQTIQIVPDLSPVKFSDMFTLKHRLLFRFTLWLAMRRAWKIVTISQAMAKEIKSHYHRKDINVIPLSINSWAQGNVLRAQINQVKEKYDLPDKYFLSISTIQPRKNYAKMIGAFAKFLKIFPEFKYVIVGKKGWKYDEVFAKVEELNVKRQVIFLNYTPDAELAPLILGSSGFLYASVYEGFGIPPLNAAYLGVPTLVSDLPVFHEILTDKEAVFVNPKHIHAIAEGMEELLKMQPNKSRTKLTQMFNWKNTAKALIDISS